MGHPVRPVHKDRLEPAVPRRLSYYYLARWPALFLFFLPKAGAGYFGLKMGSLFPVYILLVNLPFGIVTAFGRKGDYWQKSLSISDARENLWVYASGKCKLPFVPGSTRALAGGTFDVGA